LGERSALNGLTDRRADDVHDETRRGHQRRVIDRMRPKPSLHKDLNIIADQIIARNGFVPAKDFLNGRRALLR